MAVMFYEEQEFPPSQDQELEKEFEEIYQKVVENTATIGEIREFLSKHDIDYKEFCVMIWERGE
jgi:hypothetical protein